MALKHEPVAQRESVRHALRVLETVSSRGVGVTDTELESETGLASDRLAPVLRMLRRDGYVEQMTDGAYVAGETLNGLGSAQGRESALTASLQRTLDRLCETVGAAIYLGRYVDGQVGVTHVAQSPTTPVVNEWVDFRSAAHATALGKSLLGQLDLDGRLDHLSRHKMARLTSRTITNESVLLNTLDAQRATVPVLDLQEYAVGTVCAAVPITAGSSIGALALSLPIEQAHRLYQAAETLNRAAASVLLSLAI
ncbi:IclR family transcriptional regulator C-terminal domain-containing protein [Streptomyces sp. NPDC046821]|uniref:IclR family transcriptional regulator n=1 Tax=Streptomyces sp. NPDC046821 TaxID=3154702 RepID=UPI0034015797